MPTYSFKDVTCTLAGPGGVVDLGYGSGNSEEGITFSMVNPRNTMTPGADGEGMHSLRANKSAVFTARFLKTSPVNAKLMLMYDIQQAGSALWGQNALLCRNAAGNDLVAGRSVAFQKVPDLNYAVEGGIVEWVFDIIKLDVFLGEYKA